MALGAYAYVPTLVFQNHGLGHTETGSQKYEKHKILHLAMSLPSLPNWVINQELSNRVTKQLIQYIFLVSNKWNNHSNQSQSSRAEADSETPAGRGLKGQLKLQWLASVSLSKYDKHNVNLL